MKHMFQTLYDQLSELKEIKEGIAASAQLPSLIVAPHQKLITLLANKPKKQPGDLKFYTEMVQLSEIMLLQGTDEPDAKVQLISQPVDENGDPVPEGYEPPAEGTFKVSWLKHTALFNLMKRIRDQHGSGTFTSYEASLDADKNGYLVDLGVWPMFVLDKLNKFVFEMPAATKHMVVYNKGLLKGESVITGQFNDFISMWRTLLTQKYGEAVYPPTMYGSVFKGMGPDESYKPEGSQFKLGSPPPGAQIKFLDEEHHKPDNVFAEHLKSPTTVIHGKDGEIELTGGVDIAGDSVPTYPLNDAMLKAIVDTVYAQVIDKLEQKLGVKLDGAPKDDIHGLIHQLVGTPTSLKEAAQAAKAASFSSMYGGGPSLQQVPKAKKYTLTAYVNGEYIEKDISQYAAQNIAMNPASVFSVLMLDKTKTWTISGLTVSQDGTELFVKDDLGHDPYGLLKPKVPPLKKYVPKPNSKKHFGSEDWVGKKPK